MQLYYISGGQRSGKSRYAQDLALQLSPRPVYLATSRAWDDDHRQRIARHVADRPDDIALLLATRRSRPDRDR